MNVSNRSLAAAALLAWSAAGISMVVFAADKPDASKATGPSTITEDDLEFMTKAAQAGLTEVEEGKVASTKAMTPEVRSFAESMVSDHTKNNEAFKEVAAKIGATLPSELDRKHKDMIEDLQKTDTKKFDHEYVEAEVKDHKEVIEMFEKASKKARDPDLRAFAAATLNTLNHHLAMAQELKKKTDK